jgi:uncharacterized protein (TIGR02996 family)
MRSFKYADEKSHKFWNIELQGSSFTVTYGRIGSKGQSKTKDFPSPEAAQKAYDKLVAEKLAEGYIETTAAAPATTETVLETALVDDPADVAAMAAYADWLSQQGNPRGEFIQVQLALEDPARDAKERKQLQKREQELLEAHGPTWLGPLAPFLMQQQGVSEYRRKEGGAYFFTFSRGWLDHVLAREFSVAFARALAQSPQVRLLRRLEIEGLSWEQEGEYEAGDDIPAGTYAPAVHALLRCPFLGNLRIFHLGEPMEGEYSNCHTSGETAADLVARMPRLEELCLLAHRVDMEKLFALKNLANLRVLQIYHNYHYPLEILAKNSALQNLTHLLFYPHMLEPGDEGAYINLDGVRGLARSKYLKKLTHLQLRSCDMGDEGIAELIRSGMLGRLKLLDVMHGRITDEGARALAECLDAKNLELLEISYNRLSDAGIAALRSAGIAKVQATNQYSPGGDEEEYLWQGDME